MSKFVSTLTGVAEIAAGVALGFVPGAAALAPYLIAAGVGQVIHGLGTLLSKGPVSGFATTVRNPIAPWKIVYGQARVGGTIVYMNAWPNIPSNTPADNDVWLDMVIVVAAHSCFSIDALLFDQQRIQIDATTGVCDTNGTLVTWVSGINNFSHQFLPHGYIQINSVNYKIASVNSPTSITLATSAGIQLDVNYMGGGAAFATTLAAALPGSGTSFQPVNKSYPIINISRLNGVVTVTMNVNIPYLVEGDPFTITNVAGDTTLNGAFTVAQIIVQNNTSLVFTYLCGGLNTSINNSGTVNTQWQDYGRTVYFEPLMGQQILGETFAGMIIGTPQDGNMGGPHAFASGFDHSANPWTADCSLQGKTAVFLRLHYSSKYYPAGIPQISFLIRGKNDILDPRPSPPTYGYTENSALCIADMLSNTTWGFSAAYGTEIPYDFLIAAANTCDERVPLAGGLTSPPMTEAAYTCNGQFELTMQRGEILQNLLTSCAGRLTYVSGQYVIWPAAWVGNSWAIGSDPGEGVIPLGDYNQLSAGPIKWHGMSIRDLYNGVRGTYISVANKWMPSDFPPYCQDALHGYDGPPLYEGDANLAEDGGQRRWFNIQLPFTISSATAQRLAKIELLRRRRPEGTGYWDQVTLAMNMACYRIAPLDLMVATIPQLNWGSDPPEQVEVVEMRFRVDDSNEDSGPALIVELDLQQVSTAIYEWSTQEELSPQGYQQPPVPGAGYYKFFATEKVPGFNVPYPWKPGYAHPVIGDALYPGPIVGSPPENHGLGTFGIQVQYSTDAQGNAQAALLISGAPPPNELSPLHAPSLFCTVATGGNLSAGVYVVAVSAYDMGTPPRVTALSIPFTISIPPLPVNTTTSTNTLNGVQIITPASMDNILVGRSLVLSDIGFPFHDPETVIVTAVTSTTFTAELQFIHGPMNITGADDFGVINVDINWPSGSDGGKLFLGYSEVQDGLFYQFDVSQGSPPVDPSTSTTITFWDQGNSGAPDPTFDHLAIAWKKEIHGGCWAQQIVNVGPDHLIFGGAGMVENQWEGYILTLLAKIDWTQEVIVLNMRVWASTASTGPSPGPPEFALFFGTNDNGDPLPDLRGLLEAGDLMLMRFKPTFGPQNFSDPNIANPYYPLGDTNIEAGHQAIVLTGPDAGDAQTVASVSLDGDGKATIIELANPWKIQPNDGDIVIITEALWGPNWMSQAFTVPVPNAISSVVATPPVLNLALQTWVFIARAQSVGDDNGDDSFCPLREIFFFGSQGTRFINHSQTMQYTDRVVEVDCSNGPVVFTVLPFDQIPNQVIQVRKIDDSTHPVTVITSGSPPTDTINGSTSVVLPYKWNFIEFTVSGT